MGYGFKHHFRLLVAFLAMVSAVISSMAIPSLLGTAIDQSLESGENAELLIIAGSIIALGLFRVITGYVQSYFSEGVSQRAAYDIRNDFFAKLQNLSFGFHDKQQTGNFVPTLREIRSRFPGKVVPKLWEHIKTTCEHVFQQS